MLQRRRFLKLSTGAALVSATGPIWSRPAAAHGTLVERALAEGQDRVVLGAAGGTYMDLIYQHYFDPFTEATGIAVDVAGGSFSERLPRLRAMNEVGIVEWDLVALGIEDALNPTVLPLLEDLGDCTALPNVTANGIDGACVSYGVLFDLGGMVMMYDNRAFPDGGPQNWADFWDVERFPGARAFPDYGAPWWVLIPALLADGVPPDELFPLDVDRAYRKLDELRPHITVWWNSGDQSQQLFRTQEVVMAMMFSNRASPLPGDGLPVTVVWDGAILAGGVWAVTNDAPRPLAAMALLDFIYTRPEAHAAFMTEQHLAMPVRGAADLLDAGQREMLVTSPNNWPQVVRIDPIWLAENRDAELRRWTAWISG